MKTIQVLVAVPGGEEVSVQLPTSATLADALAAIDCHSVGATGVWGRVRPLAYSLRVGDRVEVYAPLKADPKDARRAKVPARRKP